MWQNWCAFHSTWSASYSNTVGRLRLLLRLAEPGAIETITFCRTSTIPFRCTIAECTRDGLLADFLKEEDGFLFQDPSSFIRERHFQPCMDSGDMLWNSRANIKSPSTHESQSPGDKYISAAEPCQAGSSAVLVASAKEETPVAEMSGLCSSGFMFFSLQLHFQFCNWELNSFPC